MAAVDHAGVKAHRVHAALAAGSVSSAAGVLEQEPLLSWTPELHAEFAALHPAKPDLPPAPEEAAAPAAITQEQLLTVLRHLKKGKAAGPGGMTYEHITAAVTGREDAIKALLRLDNLVLSGSLPHCPEFTDSRLIAAGKPHSTGVRPIAIGEVLARFASLCALAACFEVGESLAPLQLGVGVAGGTEAMSHALRAAIDAEPDSVLLMADFQNAFHTPARAEIMHAVRERAPQLERYAT